MKRGKPRGHFSTNPHSARQRQAMWENLTRASSLIEPEDELEQRLLLRELLDGRDPETLDGSLEDHLAAALADGNNTDDGDWIELGTLDLEEDFPDGWDAPKAPARGRGRPSKLADTTRHEIRRLFPRFNEGQLATRFGVSRSLIRHVLVTG